MVCHFHSDHVAGLEERVDRSMVAFVVDVGAVDVDYGRADIQRSELVGSGMIALDGVPEQLASVFELVHFGLSGSFHGMIPPLTNHYPSASLLKLAQ